MVNKIKDILLSSELEEIYLVGVFDTDDSEVIISGNFLYIEVGTYLFELEAVNSYSRIKLAITDSIEYKNDIEDMIDCKVKISDLVLINPLMANKKVKSISFYNLSINENILLTDVLLLEMDIGQRIFIDPQFLGLNIGGEEQKAFWENNNEKNYKVTKIEI